MRRRGFSGAARRQYGRLWRVSRQQPQQGLGYFSLAVSVLFRMPQHLFECSNLSLELGHSVRQLGVGEIRSRDRIKNHNRGAERNSHLAIIDPHDAGRNNLLLFRNMQFDFAGKRYWKLESQLRAFFGNVAHHATHRIILIAQTNKSAQEASLPRCFPFFHHHRFYRSSRRCRNRSFEVVSSRLIT